MPDRVKDKQEVHDHYLDNVNDNVKKFYDELEQYYPNIRVTSGKRKTSPSGKFSHHHSGNAIDIGREHADVYNFLMNDRRGLELLNKYGFGIIDETDPITMAKTKATAPHFHIGPDNSYKQIAQERLKNFDKIEIDLSYNSKNFAPPPVTNVETQTTTQLPVIPNYVKPDLEMPGGVFISQTELAKEIEKEAIKSDKIEKSEARQELVKEQETKNSLLDELNSLSPSYIMPETKHSQINQQTGYEIQDIQLDNSLPQLPSIFNF
jgi:hypothetical protein